MRIFPILVFLFLSAAVFSFSIDDYYTQTTVEKNGDIHIYEKITFTLEKKYNEGYRSVRKEDFDTLDNIVINSIKVNGQEITPIKSLNGRNAEIIWRKTYAGKNIVELDYILKDRVQLYDDFAKVCFEHYGANWPVEAYQFKSVTQLPEETREKDMHFEVYSSKKGDAYIDDLSVIIEMQNVPPENYIGGCYLFDKNATTTTKTVSGSAYSILQNERTAYGSETILAAEEKVSSALVCFPVLFIAIAVAAGFFINEKNRKKLPEILMPPEKEEPAAVSVLIRNEYLEKELLAATIIDLINSNIIEIMELEKPGAKGEEIKRERTILFLRKKPDNLKPVEKAVIEMIFYKSKEVDLDKMAEEFNAIKDRGDAKSTPIEKNMDEFKKEINAIIDSRGMTKLKNAKKDKMGWAGAVVIFLPLAVIFCGILDYAIRKIALESLLDKTAFGLGFFGTIAATAYSVKKYTEPEPPKGMEDKFYKWDSFARAVQSSRLKEYPPASAVIWGEILVYATALGMADKVNKHLSELDAFTSKRIEKLQGVATSAYVYYGSAYALRNLAKYGNRSGPISSGRGGFGRGSTGGWSSFGGGGFSGGGFSGGGGFR